MDKHLIPPFEGPLSEFPSAPRIPEGVKTVALSDTFGCSFRFLPGVVYARRSGETQHLHLLLPRDSARPEARWPLIVYIQGSAWHRQNVFEHLPHLVRVCQKGYAIAMVEYRPSELAPFPAQVMDAKAAVRFMRLHADEYAIDADRIALWGDSSGGHTSVMAGFTADGVLDDDLYPGVSCAARCIVDWYGPTEISQMNCVPSVQDHTGPDSPEGWLIGHLPVLEHPDLAARTVPMRYLKKDIPTPPLLIMHGSRDQLVHFEQSCLLYQAMREMGKEVEMIRLEGAYHGFGGFNCEEAVALVLDFLDRHL